jgi:predicted ATP-dependent endonuclease of OLD family
MKANEFNNYILVDNFRGFSKTVIPLKKTNFFVGENSSGKSSILGLIKILSEINFWFRHEFKTEDINLGHSEDLISVNSQDRTYFRVGYLRDDETEDNKHIFQKGFLITFEDKNGSPELKNISIEVENSILHIKLSTAGLSYKIEDEATLVTKNIEEANKKLNYLVDIHDNGLGYKKVKIINNLEVKDRLNIQNCIYIVIEELSKTRKLNYYHTFPQVRPIWLAPIRSKPKRTYDEPSYEFSSEGEHTPYLIKSLLANKSTESKLTLEKIGKNTGLFKEISPKKFGRTKNAPFELDIILDNEPLNIINVGYGVSQVMPIVTELIARPKNSWFIIQQPEVHLHPKAQAAIGDLLFEGSHTCLVETHSDYLIDRFRLRTVKRFKGKKVNKVDCSDAHIVFCSRDKGVNYVQSIGILENGELDANQPKKYREFFIKEQMDILGL